MTLQKLEMKPQWWKYKLTELSIFIDLQKKTNNNLLTTLTSLQQAIIPHLQKYYFDQALWVYFRKDGRWSWGFEYPWIGTWRLKAWHTSGHAVTVALWAAWFGPRNMHQNRFTGPLSHVYWILDQRLAYRENRDTLALISLKSPNWHLLSSFSLEL